MSPARSSVFSKAVRRTPQPGDRIRAGLISFVGAQNWRAARIMVTTRRGPDLCDVDAITCISGTTRFVWAGDQILWELKQADGPADASGQVSYFHAGGIDRPLAIWKAGVGSIVPHQNWRGQFARGTFAANGAPSDCQTYPPSGCIPIRWPGWSTTAWHEDAGKQPVTGYEHYWFGSLSVGMRDASGLMYMRNRYYDPQTGQFTQTDPPRVRLIRSSCPAILRCPIRRAPPPTLTARGASSAAAGARRREPIHPHPDPSPP